MIKVYLKVVEDPIEYENADHVHHGEQFTVLLDGKDNYVASFPNTSIRQIEATDN